MCVCVCVCKTSQQQRIRKWKWKKRQKAKKIKELAKQDTEEQTLNWYVCRCCVGKLNYHSPGVAEDETRFVNEEAWQWSEATKETLPIWLNVEGRKEKRHCYVGRGRDEKGVYTFQRYLFPSQSVTLLSSVVFIPLNHLLPSPAQTEAWVRGSIGKL